MQILQKFLHGFESRDEIFLNVENMVWVSITKIIYWVWLFLLGYWLLIVNLGSNLRFVNIYQYSNNSSYHVIKLSCYLNHTLKQFKYVWDILKVKSTTIFFL